MKVLEDLNKLCEQKLENAEALNKRVAEILFAVQEVSKGNEESTVTISKITNINKKTDEKNSSAFLPL